ncbi:hypothetical protein N9N03_00955 [Chlamydiia bacterium]|nr:hypothetical protein [Chlamydiia bacterium]
MSEFGIQDAATQIKSEKTVADQFGVANSSASNQGIIPTALQMTPDSIQGVSASGNTASTKTTHDTYAASNNSSGPSISDANSSTYAALSGNPTPPDNSKSASVTLPTVTSLKLLLLELFDLKSRVSQEMEELGASFFYYMYQQTLMLINLEKKDIKLKLESLDHERFSASVNIATAALNIVILFGTQALLNKYKPEYTNAPDGVETANPVGNNTGQQARIEGTQRQGQTPVVNEPTTIRARQTAPQSVPESGAPTPLQQGPQPNLRPGAAPNSGIVSPPVTQTPGNTPIPSTQTPSSTAGPPNSRSELPGPIHDSTATNAPLLGPEGNPNSPSTQANPNVDQDNIQAKRRDTDSDKRADYDRVYSEFAQISAQGIAVGISQGIKNVMEGDHKITKKAAKKKEETALESQRFVNEQVKDRLKNMLDRINEDKDEVNKQLISILDTLKDVASVDKDMARQVARTIRS